MSENLFFILMAYILPMIVCILGFRISISLKYLDPGFNNTFVTFCPFVNTIIASLFTIMLIGIGMNYVVNGSYKE